VAEEKGHERARERNHEPVREKAKSTRRRKWHIVDTHVPVAQVPRKSPSTLSGGAFPRATSRKRASVDAPATVDASASIPSRKPRSGATAAVTRTLSRHGKKGKDGTATQGGSAGIATPVSFGGRSHRGASVRRSASAHSHTAHAGVRRTASAYAPGDHANDSGRHGYGRLNFKGMIALLKGES
jgi:hypothetical protein